MARPSELVPGNCYFMLNFYESDPPLVVPSVHTYLFVGREKREGQASPISDYLSNAGQVRMLSYALPRDEAAAIALCGRLLAEVYEMREDDELIFSFHPKEQVRGV